jgi:hypothetical protein
MLSYKKYIILVYLVLLCSCALAQKKLYPDWDGRTYNINKNPGLCNQDGTPHLVPKAFEKTGKILNVIFFGADPTDNNHNDLIAIKKAIESAEPGDEVFFPNGIYNLLGRWDSKTSKVQILIEKSGLVFRGESERGVILKSNFDDSHDSKRRYVMRILGVHDVVIKNFTFTSYWDRTFSERTNQNNPKRGGPTYMIGIQSREQEYAFNIFIEHVTVERYRRFGIVVRGGCHDIVIKYCTALKATDLGNGGAGYGFVLQGKKHNTAPENPFLNTTDDTYNCVIDSCTTKGPYIRHAVILQYWTHNNLITNCNFTSQLDSIDLHGEDEYNNEISCNTINNIKRESGIGIGNKGATHDRSGPYNWIHHNTIIGCKKGITIQYGSDYQYIEKNIIRDNTHFSNGYGIGLGKTMGSIIKDNIIQDCTAKNFSPIYFFHDRELKTRNGEKEPAGNAWFCEIINNNFYRNSKKTITWDEKISSAAKVTIIFKEEK